MRWLALTVALLMGIPTLAEGHQKPRSHTPKAPRFDAKAVPVEPVQWDFPCPVPEKSSRTEITIYGEEHPNVGLFDGLKAKGTSDRERYLRQRYDLARSVMDQKSLLGLEGVRYQALSLSSPEDKVERFVTEWAPSALIPNSEIWRKEAFGMEGDRGLVLSNLFFQSYALWGERSDRIYKKATLATLRSKTFDQLAYLLSESESAQLGWKNVSRPFKDEDQEETAKILDLFVGKPNNFLGLQTLDPEKRKPIDRAVNSKDFRAVIQAWTKSQLLLEKNSGLLGSPSEVEGYANDLSEIYKTQRTDKYDRLSNIILIDLRNKEWIESIGKAYCRAIKLRLPLNLLMGRSHVPGIQKLLIEATHGLVKVIGPSN